LKNTVVVSPDLGNAKEASHFARSLGLPMAAGSKKRLSDDRVVIDALVGKPHGKECGHGRPTFYDQLLKICERADKPGRPELADGRRARTSK
jgi:hypothetical protein